MEDDYDGRYTQRWRFAEGIGQILTYCRLSCVCNTCLGNDFTLRTHGKFVIEIEER